MPPVWINYLLITYGPLSFDYLQVLKFSDIIILHIVSFVFECVLQLILEIILQVSKLYTILVQDSP